jgi:hypothetical protein
VSTNSSDGDAWNHAAQRLLPAQDGPGNRNLSKDHQGNP